MLNGVRKFAIDMTVGLVLTGCPEGRGGSEHQAVGEMRERLGCVVLCEKGREGGDHSTFYQCSPGIPESGMEEAHRVAYQTWRQLPQDERPECPSMKDLVRDFTGITMIAE